MTWNGTYRESGQTTSNPAVTAFELSVQRAAQEYAANGGNLGDVKENVIRLADKTGATPEEAQFAWVIAQKAYAEARDGLNNSARTNGVTTTPMVIPDNKAAIVGGFITNKPAHLFDDPDKTIEKGLTQAFDASAPEVSQMSPVNGVGGFIQELVSALKEVLGTQMNLGAMTV